MFIFVFYICISGNIASNIVGFSSYLDDLSSWGIKVANMDSTLKDQNVPSVEPPGQDPQQDKPTTQIEDVNKMTAAKNDKFAFYNVL